MEYKRSKRGRAHEAQISSGKRHKRGRVDDAALVLRLPEHLISDILLRLPIESISCCKCVCKTLEKILRDPRFAKLHLTNSSETDRRLIIPYKCYTRDSDISRQGSNHHDHDRRPWKTVVIPPVISQSEYITMSVFGSCNGLLGLQYSRVYNTPILYVCNPILGEYMLLPEPKPSANVMFGYCPNTEEYKVIQFISCPYRHGQLISYSLCEIHTLGTDSWRSIGNVTSPHVFDNSTYLNGKLHWVALGVGLSYVICSFNLEAESVFDIPAPSHLVQRNSQGRMALSSLRVGVMGGLLCVSYILEKVQFEVFVMKNYGVKDSWTKQFTIDTNCNFVSQALLVQIMKEEKIRCVSLQDNGDLLLYYLYFPLIYYSPRKGRVWDILGFARDGRDLNRLSEVTYGRYYVPSLISLKEIAGSGNVQIVQPKKLSDKWSQEKVPHRRA